MLDLNDSPITKLEKAKKNPSKFRLSIINWISEKNEEEKIKLFSITNKKLINALLKMKHKYSTNRKSVFKWHISQDDDNNEFGFASKGENDKLLTKEENLMMNLFEQNVRIISVYEENDTLTLSPKCLQNRQSLEYESLQFSKKKIFEEPCLYIII